MNTHDKIELPPPAQRIPYVGDVWTRGQIEAAIETGRQRRGEPVLCVSSDAFKRLRAGDDCVKAFLPPTTSAEDMPLYTIPQPTEPANPRVKFEDPRVQQVYEIICGEAPPPEGEHWDGYVSRLIVDALCPAEWVKAPSDAEIETLAFEHCDETGAGGDCPKFIGTQSLRNFALALLSRYGSAQPAVSAEPMGFKNFHRMLCERFGYPHDESDWHRDQVSLMEHIAAKHAINEMPIELRGVAETLAEGGGSWRTCCGCHELNEGHSTGPYSNALQCHLGCGCSECGGIGAVWDDTDYDEMADHMARDMSAPVAVQPGVILPMGLRAVATELLACFRAWEPGVRVLGNVQAKDGADLMQAILAPTTPADGLAQQDALPVTPQEDEAWAELERRQ